MASSQEELLMVVADFSFEKGWITEEEKLEIITSKTLEGKKMSVLALIAKKGSHDNAARLSVSMQCISEVILENPKEKENRLRQTIMLTLFDKGLVTKKEMENFEFLVLQESDAENYDLTIPEDDQQKPVNPLELGPVIDCVLKFLNFEQLKKCRLISKEWAKAGLQILKLCSIIKFHGDSPETRNPAIFLQLFVQQNEKEKSLNFNSFQFTGSKDNPWAVKELNNFFKIQKKYITELSLLNLSLVDDSGDKVESYNITHWITKSPMAFRNSKIKTKFQVSNDVDETKLAIDLRGLCKIYDLDLHECTMNLEDGIQMRPHNLALTSVTVCRDGSEVGEICVNDFVDFEEIRNIKLVSKTNQPSF